MPQAGARASAGRSVRRFAIQARALIWAARRLLWRAAWFLWITFLSAIRSRTLAAARSWRAAPALSPAAIALRTLFTALRNADRSDVLCWRRFSAWRARLRAWAVLAIGVGASKRRGL